MKLQNRSIKVIQTTFTKVNTPSSQSEVKYFSLLNSTPIASNHLQSSVNKRQIGKSKKGQFLTNRDHDSVQLSHQDKSLLERKSSVKKSTDSSVHKAQKQINPHKCQIDVFLRDNVDNVSREYHSVKNGIKSSRPQSSTLSKRNSARNDNRQLMMKRQENIQMKEGHTLLFNSTLSPYKDLQRNTRNKGDTTYVHRKNSLHTQSSYNKERHEARKPNSVQQSKRHSMTYILQNNSAVIKNGEGEVIKKKNVLKSNIPKKVPTQISMIYLEKALSNNHSHNEKVLQKSQTVIDHPNTLTINNDLIDVQSCNTQKEKNLNNQSAYMLDLEHSCHQSSSQRSHDLKLDSVTINHQLRESFLKNNEVNTSAFIDRKTLFEYTNPVSNLLESSMTDLHPNKQHQTKNNIIDIKENMSPPSRSKDHQDSVNSASQSQQMSVQNTIDCRIDQDEFQRKQLSMKNPFNETQNYVQQFLSQYSKEASFQNKQAFQFTQNVLSSDQLFRECSQKVSLLDQDHPSSKMISPVESLQNFLTEENQPEESANQCRKCLVEIENHQETNKALEKSIQLSNMLMEEIRKLDLMNKKLKDEVKVLKDQATCKSSQTTNKKSVRSSVSQELRDLKLKIQNKHDCFLRKEEGLNTLIDRNEEELENIEPSEMKMRGKKSIHETPINLKKAPSLTQSIQKETESHQQKPCLQSQLNNMVHNLQSMKNRRVDCDSTVRNVGKIVEDILETSNSESCKQSFGSQQNPLDNSAKLNDLN